MKVAVLLLVVLLFGGCTGGQSNTVVGEPNINLGEIVVNERTVGYGNLPGYGTHFEYFYDVDVAVMNAGPGVTYELRVFGRPVNVVNPPWIRLTTYGPVPVSAGALQTIDFSVETGTQGYGSWRFDLHIVGDSQGPVDSKTVTRTR